jgi:hypothetical protein
MVFRDLRLVDITFVNDPRRFQKHPSASDEPQRVIVRAIQTDRARTVWLASGTSFSDRRALLSLAIPKNQLVSR